ncbi:unnamed protein product [Arctogadus glacialis]
MHPSLPEGEQKGVEGQIPAVRFPSYSVLLLPKSDFVTSTPQLRADDQTRAERSPWVPGRGALLKGRSQTDTLALAPA